MDPLGKLSHVGIAPEKIWGTAVTAADWLKFSSESLSLQIEDLVEASIQGTRDEPPSYEGLGTISGNTVHEVHPKGLGYLMRSWFGQPVTLSRTSSYQHIFTPAAAAVPAKRRGTATAGTTTTLTDSAAESWGVNEFAGWWLHIVEGTGADQWSLITSNTATELTVETLGTAPSTDSIYEIIPGPKDCALPPYTIEVNRDIPGSSAAFQFKGLVANTLAFSFGVSNKILTLTAGWLGKDVANIAASTPSMPSTEPFKWSEAKIGIGTYDSGTATGGSTSTLVKATANWAVDALIGKLIMKTNAAGDEVEVRPITDNDATTITVSPSFTEAAANTDTFEIFDCPETVESLEFTLDNGLVALPTLNYTKRVSRIVGDSFRTGSLTCSMIPQSKTDFATYYSGWTTRRWLVWFKGQQIGSTGHYHQAAFLFPKVLMTAYPVNVGGAGRILVSVAAKMKYDSSAGYLVKGFLYNDKSAYSA